MLGKPKKKQNLTFLLTFSSFDGSGVTRELKKFILDVRRFVDTPGLDDDLCREQCAAQITEALKLGGYYAICFVISVRGS